MSHLPMGLATGLLAGAHIAIWGMYKDSPHEGFTWWRFSRAIVLAGLLGLALAPLTGLDLTRPAGLVVLFGTVYAAERALEELYKTFLREEDQSKYTIPMQFHVFGRVVQSRLVRWSAAAGLLLVVTLLAWSVAALDRTPYAESILVVAGVGTVGSWVSAVGGAWKDAPIEGFETLKFFRSPGIALVYALLIAALADSLLLIALGAAGYTVATIETYKTFFFPSRPRGKFSDKPVLNPEMLRRRNAFVPLYVGIWVLIVVGFGTALLQRLAA
jgi:uncharacterized membrane protein